MLFRCRATGFRKCVTGGRRKGIARDLGEVAVEKVGSREPRGGEDGAFQVPWLVLMQRRGWESRVPVAVGHRGSWWVHGVMGPLWRAEFVTE